MKRCTLCREEFDETVPVSSIFQEAGAWLAEEVWRDGGELCPRCLENRARLVMMYAHDCNT
ncbi:hypothetical protein [Trichlorobacter ammonificans]|uniref:Uncharacterized protein n=1 Tax=Trichlorobacter ammonificans TaxID=2916410 RepID=A0ABM9DC24_9BACT|nr:hypothetical protein [Trichlorobacter ammonificans]CAH2032257.1 conserved protein of unknown function [Trichlorobacter ammonificans]